MTAIPTDVPSRTPIPLPRIRRFSLLMDRFCLLLIVGVPLTVLAYWLGADQATLASNHRLGHLAIQQPLALWQRLAGATIALVPLGMGLAGLTHSRRCFRLFAAGHYFVPEVVTHLRRFAAWTCGSVAASFAMHPLMSVMLTLHNAPGQRQLTIGINSDLLFTLFVAGMVWLIAAVMGHAHALAEENAQFV